MTQIYVVAKHDYSIEELLCAFFNEKSAKELCEELKELDGELYQYSYYTVEVK